MRFRKLVVTALVLSTVSAVLVAQQPSSAAQQPQQTFRSGITIVPVDVRVVDRNGKPITDLKQEDFTIVEDGVPQKIVHFAFHALTPMTVADPDAPLDFRKPLGDTLVPQNRRIFLLVLGTGRQVGPVKGVEAAMKFVKERLLPQDHVAILAYNRATDFTADHKKVIDTLKRYWDKHESIEARMRHHFSGLAAQYAKREIPPHIQKDVDAIFNAPGALTSRSLTGTGVSDGAQIADDNRRTSERIQRAEIAAERIAAGFGTPFDQSAIEEAALNDMPFDEYVEKASDTQDDLAKLYAGLRYLRYLDGEKHMVFLTPNGLFLPRLENSNSIAALANDARVSVDIIHTGGMAGGAAPLPPSLTPRSAGAAAAAALRSATPSASVVFGQTFAVGSSRQISNLTGGTTTAFQSGNSAFEKLDESTRAQYLLGYAPSNDNWNGGYRRITVRVNRRDARVLYRHGYAARKEITPLTRQQYLTYSRVAAAANASREITDFKFTMSVSHNPSTDPATLSLDMHIPPGGVRLVKKDGMYVGKVEALYFCADKKELLIGEYWHTLDFNLTEENYQKFQREGVSFKVPVTIEGDPQYVKGILYDYGADLVGSVMRDFRKK
jgi:VWFA-related protein